MVQWKVHFRRAETHKANLCALSSPTWEACCLTACLYLTLCFFMALNAIFIISWARRGQSLAWRDGQRERQTNRAAHSHRCGAETIILMRLCQQGAFYRARGANSRNVQQQRKKERKSSCLPHMYGKQLVRECQRSISCLRGLRPDRFSRSLKWTLAHERGRGRLSASHQSPRHVEKIRMSAGFGALIHLLSTCFQRPNESSINGVLTGYRLYYRELPVNTSTEADVQATSNNSASVLITSESRQQCR